MTIPAMKEDILSNLTPDIEKQLNIMHAMYLVMQCCCDSAKGYQVFKTLQELKVLCLPNYHN